MPMYKKKPVEIEAVQFTGHNFDEIRAFAGDKVRFDYHDTAWEVGKGPVIASAVIDTLEGSMRASKGDYIIKGVQGEFYPCKPDIFEQTYEEE